MESDSPGRAVGRVAAGEVFVMEGTGVATLAMAFPFAAAEVETKKRLPWLVGQLPATAFPFVAAVVGTEKRLPWLVSQFLTTAFPFVAAEFETEKRLPRLVG